MMDNRYQSPAVIEHDACGIGAVVNIDGHREHQTLSDALSIVEKLDHRAGKDASGKVGDGVGVLTQISWPFFEKAAKASGIDLPGEEKFAVGMFFLPQGERKAAFSMRMFEVVAEKQGIPVLGWRKVPTHPEILGKLARDCMPDIRQCFLGIPKGTESGFPFEQKLYALRREYEQSAEDTYICSLSSRTIVYKGMFLVTQLRQFFDDLRDPDFAVSIAVVHSRFSTNTTPSWQRAHPYRMLVHNGEINTIRGNIDRMNAREETMSSPYMDREFDRILPAVQVNGSDSAMLDNTLEFFYMNGLDLPLAMMSLIPEPWRRDRDMPEEKKDFYHYYSTMMEPWDGPAAVLFTDGIILGATLDRNGLRPSRYYVTDDGRLILSSEVGVLDIPPEKIVKKSRLQPGRMLLVDTAKKRIISDEECKEYYSRRNPYGEWLDQNLLHLENLPIPNRKIPMNTQDVRDRLYKFFGYTYEDVKNVILPMATNAIEETASMGHDTPLAALSDVEEPLFHYFKQLFAQVTNPPIDSLREEIVTDTAVYIGSDGNLLEEKPENCRMLEIPEPILTGVDLLKIQSLDKPGFRTKTIPILYYKNTSLKRAVEQLEVRIDHAYTEGYNIIILTDRGVDENHVAIPSLLAVSAVEQHLVQTKKRTAISLVIETGEARDVHQMAALLGFGARAICPYLAHECIHELIHLGILDKDPQTAIRDYDKALLFGIVKIAAKMGISTIQSYQSARIFEAVGLDKELIDEYFPGTVSRVGGIGLKQIADGVTKRHDKAFDPMGLGVDTTLDSPGFHFLRSGDGKEEHLYRPETLIALREATQSGSYEKFKEYSKMIDEGKAHHLRSLLDFKQVNEPISIDQVEPVSSIVKRFQTGAMSYGSLSQEAHECMAIAMNRLGGKSNTGEGGEAEERFGTERNSAVKQVASGRFGVTIQYLGSAKEIQIKMAQGAKPGEGGNLPGKKVYPWVAATRHATPGVSLISPPPHHDIYSIEDLGQLIYDLKNANENAGITVKLVSENGVGTIACGVAKAGAEAILISGYDGGTGAAPSSSIHNAALPWELGIAEAHRELTKNGLRSRVRVMADGKLMTGRDVAIAALLGAEEFGFATAPLVAMGCMMMRVCSKDTCPFGIATQNETLRKRFRGKPEYVMNFMTFIAEELREIMARLGFRTVDEMVGRVDCLKKKDAFKDSPIDVSYLLEQVPQSGSKSLYDFHLEKTADEAILIPALEEKIKKGEPGSVSLKVSSTNRTFGTILGSRIAASGKEFADDTYVVNCEGGGGQSFGAFIPKGLTLRLTGDANDGVGKGLSGGKIIVVPPKESVFKAQDNIIAGNVALYGATSGTVYLAGIAGERFCVRNSGATAVAEGCGDHGLEYMTGGRAVILGPTGRNFAAGMSGGIAYVLDQNHVLYRRLNHKMVKMYPLEDKYDIQELKDILADYVRETQSVLGTEILSDFDHYLPSFKKIIPTDYQRMMLLIGRYEEQGISRENAEKEAFRALALKNA